VLLLGPPEIEVDGRPLAVDTRKAIALLAYLAIIGSARSRDQLATLLWPELDPERGRATLRRTLSALRAGLGGRFVSSDRSRVWLEPEGVRIDANEAAALSEPAADHGHNSDEVCPACAERLAAAAALHRDTFLAGFAVRDSPDFEDWHRAEEEKQTRALRQILERLALAMAAGGRFQQAATTVRRRVALDPLDEPARRQLMLLLAWNGDRPGALQAYRECAAVLDRELGVAPLPETRLLYEQIVEGTEPAAPAGRVIPGPVPAARTTAPPAEEFVGRAEELARLREATASLILITGEEGIGKSRLVEEWLAGSGRRVVRTAALPGASAPYLTIRDALVAAAADRSLPSIPREAGEATRLVPELAALGFPDPPTEEGPGAIVRFQAGVGVALACLLPGGVLFIDDGQWMDESTVATLTYLLTHPRPESPQVVVAMRDEDIAPTHPLLQVGRQLERSAGATRIALGPLSPVESRALATSRSSSLDTDGVSRLQARAGGNPLYLLSYLDVTSSEQSELPPRLEQLVSARLDGLDETARQVLAAAAVLGSDSEQEMVQAVSGRSDEEMASAIETLVRKRLLRENGVRIAFTHDVMRRGTYDLVSATRRRLLHSRAADAYHRQHEPAARARHLETAGRLSEAAVAHLQAGELAASIYAYPEAQTHLESALACGHPDRDGINLLLGDIAVRMGRYGKAIEAFQAVDSSERRAEIEHRIGSVYRRLRRWSLAENAYRSAAALTSERALLGAITADRALVAHGQGDDETARALAAEAHELATGAGDVALSAQALSLSGMLAKDPMEGIGPLREAADLAESTGRSELLASVLNNLALALRRNDELDAAEQVARQALAVLEPLGDRHLLAALHSNLADTLHACGNEVDAQHHLRESARLFSEVGIEEGEWEPEIWKLAEW
jgi:DNA-binding SARP family transcriptional activator